MQLVDRLHASLADLELGSPRRWEERAGIASRELSAEEMFHPLGLHALLLHHKVTQLLHVGEAVVGGHEAIALLAPVGHVGVEDGLKELLVLRREHLDAVLRDEAINALEEGLTKDKASLLLAPEGLHVAIGS